VILPRIPTAAAILDVLRNPPVRQTPERPGEEQDEILVQVLALRRNNAEQWDREDDARRHRDNDTMVAAAKRDIDRLNGARHGFIEAIDRSIVRALKPHDEASLVTESPGMAIDRLSVLVIRLLATEARAASGAPDAALYADRLPQLRSQLDSLEEAVATLLNDLAAGRRRFSAYESFKLYGPADPGQVG
jgi:hypothetical protein